MLEFILAFMPVFVLFLGIVQLTLLAVAQLVVRHAAITAARSAVVVLPDDPRHYLNEPINHIDPPASLLGMAATVVAARLAGVPMADALDDHSRISAIHTAAYVPLAAIAPDAALSVRMFGWSGASNVATALGSSGVGRLAFGVGVYLPIATAVTFPVAPGARELQELEVSTDPVVVRVTHLVPCAVPLAGALLCRKLKWAAGCGGWRAPARPTRPARHCRSCAPQPALRFRIDCGPARLPVAVLQAEASMPAQPTRYPYPVEARQP